MSHTPFLRDPSTHHHHLLAKTPPPQNPNLSLLRLCAHLREATQVHALMIKTSQSSDPYSAGRLAEFYAVSPGGSLDFAAKLLDTFRDHPPPMFIYNTLMRGYLLKNHPCNPFISSANCSLRRPSPITSRSLSHSKLAPKFTLFVPECSSTPMQSSAGSIRMPMCATN
uniref:Pentatricopeptide repeat-containing protein n=1 Tax=Ananas comosus var. bracteatus TaxID=296719 RepID=A0A6V7QY76_ANACO